ELTGVEEYRFWDHMREKRKADADEEASEDELRSVIEEKVVGIVMNRPEFVRLLKGKGVEGSIRDRDLGEVLSKLLDYHEGHASLDIKLFLNVLERPELREKAVRSSMDAAGCDEQEMERIVLDYLSYVEKK